MDEFNIEWLDEAIDTVDSAFFTGDSFFEKQNNEKMRQILARWQKQLDVCIEIGCYS
jgi:hypothetical protein